jgi:putative acetyltransferase
MRIRDYEDTDLASVLAIVRAGLLEYGFSPDTGGLDTDLRTIRERYTGPRAGFWVAEEAGEVKGTVALRAKDADTCELKRLYVRADARGSGVGRALYAHAEAFARAAGYARIWLD